jgi:pyruvate/2-oxoglutarate dehydrogenase complex dihydrolipoamide acyltransferase (E2) component
MAARDWTPIAMPELRAGEVRVVQWLLDVGANVSCGDRLLEVLADGVLLHLQAETAGTLMRLDVQRGAALHRGVILGWIAPAGDATEDG